MKHTVLNFIYLAMVVLFISASIQLTYSETSDLPTHNTANGAITQENEGNATGDLNLVDKSVRIMSDGQAMLYKLAMAAFPLSIIIMLFTLFFVHQERAVALILRGCATILIASVAIMLTDAGYVLDTLKTLIGIS